MTLVQLDPDSTPKTREQPIRRARTPPSRQARSPVRPPWSYCRWARDLWRPPFLFSERPLDSEPRVWRDSRSDRLAVLLSRALSLSLCHIIRSQSSRHSMESKEGRTLDGTSSSIMTVVSAGAMHLANFFYMPHRYIQHPP